MKLLATNGREYSIQPLQYLSNESLNKSAGHILTRKILKELFPTEWILEEIPLRVNGTTLYLDFLIKRPGIAVEVQGSQHTKFNAFFHKSVENFAASKKRDSLKRDWCKLNQLTLIELYDGETEEEWYDKLCRR